MNSIPANVAAVKAEIAAAELRAGRASGSVGLVAVSKTVGIPQVEEALEAGCAMFGENRVQEAARKLEVLAGRGEWHLTGHLQRNKVKTAVGLFDLIHSVDSAALVQEISRRALDAGKRQRVLLQVNTSGEPSKYGVAPEQAVALARAAAGLPGITVEGLMTIGAFLPDPEQVRPCFKLLRALRDEINGMNLEGVSMRHLSMGMTNDYTVAIEEGATLVRVGRAIFGERN